MQAGASGSVSHYKRAGRSSRLAKVLVLPKERSAISGAPSEGTPTHPLRQHKNVTFRKSIIKLEEKLYVRTRPEKSSGGEGLRPPLKRCSKHRALTKVRSADQSEVASGEEDMEESLISNREQSRHTDSRSADYQEQL